MNEFFRSDEISNRTDLIIQLKVLLIFHTEGDFIRMLGDVSTKNLLS